MGTDLQERIDGEIYRCIPMVTDQESRYAAESVMKVVAAELAAAERRGGVRALREAAEELYQWVGLGADDEVYLGDVAKGLKIRAEIIEGNHGE